ncbi:hypothetical protein MMC29_002498 [Sticta canariensis]|nr:hypothetical protein [Sticta canariensis]
MQELHGFRGGGAVDESLGSAPVEAVEVEALAASMTDGVDMTNRFTFLTPEEEDDIFKDLLNNTAAEEDSDEGLPVIAKFTKHKRRQVLRAWGGNIDCYQKRFNKTINHVDFWKRLCASHSAPRSLSSSKESRHEELSTASERLSLRRLMPKYLFPKRNPNPSSLHWMVLKRPKNYPGWADKGPVSQISHWMYGKGAKEMGLLRNSEYETIEMTAREVGRLLKTLRLRADNIPVQKPIRRAIFHAIVLLCAYGGFRKGMVIGKFKFRDIKMAIIRDPVDRDRRHLVAITEITRNKLKEDAMEHKKGEKCVIHFLVHFSARL